VLCARAVPARRAAAQRGGNDVVADVWPARVGGTGYIEVWAALAGAEDERTLVRVMGAPALGAAGRQRVGELVLVEVERHRDTGCGRETSPDRACPWRGSGRTGRRVHRPHPAAARASSPRMRQCHPPAMDSVSSVMSWRLCRAYPSATAACEPPWNGLRKRMPDAACARRCQRPALTHLVLVSAMVGACASAGARCWSAVVGCWSAALGAT
jgi:hypothetical protein